MKVSTWTPQFHRISSMLGIFGLSRYILLSILSDWISRDDALLLDSACCNKARRAVLLVAYGTFPYHFKKILFPFSDIIVISGLYNWLKVRNMDCVAQDIEITPKSFLSNSEGYLDGSWSVAMSQVRQLTIKYLKERHISLLRTQFSTFSTICCFNLSYLDSSCVNNVLFFMTQVCHQLTSITIHNCIDFKPSIVAVLCRMNPSLECISCNTPNNYRELILTVVVNCRRIKSVQISHSDRVSLFLLHCPSSLISFSSFSCNTVLLSYYHGMRLSRLQIMDTKRYQPSLLGECFSRLTELKLCVLSPLSDLLKHLPSTITNISFLTSILDADLQFVGMRCPEIQTLRLTTSNMFSYQFQLFLHLTNLDIVYASPETLNSLAVNCKMLKILLVDVSVEVAPLANLLVACRELVSLRLRVNKPDIV